MTAATAGRLARAAGFGAALGLGFAPLHGQAPLAPALRPYVALDAPLVALTHVSVVDGTGRPALADQTLLIEGSSISAVGPSATLTIPPEAAVVDLGGHTLLPGFVGLHEHTYFAGVSRVTPMNASAPVLYLAYGTTTAMTAGSQLPYHELNLKRAVEAGDTPGPRFVIAGPYLDGGASRSAMSLKLVTPEDARRTVAYWAAEGAGWVKFLGRVTREVLQAGIDEAHARGLRVTGHLCSVTFAEAADLGIDLLQHGYITDSGHVPGKRPDVCPPENMRVQADIDVDGPSVQEGIRTLVERGTAVASTLAVYETFVADHALDPRGLEALEPATRQEVEAVHAGLAKAEFAVPRRLLKKMMAWERAFVAAGGLLGAGTDPWGTGLLPGLGGLRNYELLVEAGFAPVDAIRVMTLNGARILGEERRIGSIEIGKRADLVVVRGDPVRRPADIYEVVTVFKDGVGYDSTRLRQAARGKVGVN